MRKASQGGRPSGSLQGLLNLPSSINNPTCNWIFGWKLNTTQGPFQLHCVQRADRNMWQRVFELTCHMAWGGLTTCQMNPFEFEKKYLDPSASKPA